MKSLMKTLNRVLSKFEEEDDPDFAATPLEQQKETLQRVTRAQQTGDIYNRPSLRGGMEKLRQPPPFDNREMGGISNRSGQQVAPNRQSGAKTSQGSGDSILRDIARQYDVSSMTQFQMIELADLLHRCGYLQNDEAQTLAEGTQLSGVLQTPSDYVCDMIAEWQKALAMELGRNDMMAVNKVSRILIVLGRLAEARRIQRSVA